jgi:hypothetical protein
MNAPVSAPPAVDLLAQAVERVKKLMLADSNKPTKARIRLLWSAAKNARDLGTPDVVCDEFVALAIEVNLIDQHGRWIGSDVRESVRSLGAEAVDHVLRWALRGWNPFEKGPLK